MSFDKQAHIAKMQPYANKMIAALNKRGVTFSYTDEDRENVVFSFEVREVKIAYHCFYRISGLACVYRDVGENFSEAVEVTDEMYMNMYMKQSVEVNLGLK